MCEKRKLIKKVAEGVVALILLILLLLGVGCASISIPKIEADKVDCEYHREHKEVTWKCEASGKGDVDVVEVF